MGDGKLCFAVESRRRSGRSRRRIRIRMVLNRDSTHVGGDNYSGARGDRPL